MASYPDSIYEPREKEQRSGVEYIPEKKSVIFVEDVKKLDDEVVAIETDLMAKKNQYPEFFGYYGNIGYTLTNRYISFGSSGSATAYVTLEALVLAAGKITKMGIQITTNTYNQPITFWLTKNGVDTDMAITFAAEEVGTKIDDQHEVELAVGDKICIHFIHASTTGTIWNLKSTLLKLPL